MQKKVVQTARCWIGTPYVHQASVRQVGADCLGFVRGVWRDTMGEEPEIPPPYTYEWGEMGDKELLWEACKRHFPSKPLDKSAAGDVILFRMHAASVAKHIGIQSDAGDTPMFIHAYSGHGVIESPLNTAWRRKITARFYFPKVRLV